MTPIRLAIPKTYKNKKESFKNNIPKHVFVEYVSTTTKHSYNNFNYAIFIFHINRKIV